MTRSKDTNYSTTMSHYSLIHAHQTDLGASLNHIKRVWAACLFTVAW